MIPIDTHDRNGKLYKLEVVKAFENLQKQVMSDLWVEAPEPDSQKVSLEQALNACESLGGRIKICTTL